MNSWMMLPEPRVLSRTEKSILDRLLEPSCRGMEELRRQVATAKIGRVDTEGCIGFLASDLPGLRAELTQRVPVEAHGFDIDGVEVSVLLHVVDGYLHTLEFMRHDGQMLKALPEAQALSVVCMEDEIT